MRKLLARGAILIYLMSAVAFSLLTVRYGRPAEGAGGFDMNATDLGVMCISAAYPAMGIELADSRDNEALPEEGGAEGGGADQQGGAGGEEGAGGESAEGAGEETQGPTVSGDDPLVLIVHTHATESYLPASAGNFHSREEENTVRDVGDSLAATLESLGVPVVHDKTLHDYPSYNSSYSRSYETVSALLAQYPSVQCVIDLHRDAVASDSPASTVSVGGRTCARYSYVIGTGAATYQSNRAFVDSLNAEAAANHGGFTGKVLERGYKYNQDLSAKYLLLEIGYNTNQIEDCRNTAEVFGEILAAVWQEG